MGIWATVGEAAATMGGDEAGAAKFSQQREGQQKLRDEYRQKKIADATQARHTLQKMIALSSDPNTFEPLPGQEQRISLFKNKLQQLDAYTKKLYNPQFDPMEGTSPQGFWGKQKPMAGAQEQGAVAEQYAMEPPEQDKFKEFQRIYKEATGKDVPGEVSEAWAKKQGGLPAEKSDPENWTVVTGVTGDGKPFTFQHNSKDGKSETLGGEPIPEEQLQGFTVPPKGSGPKVGTLGAFLTEAYGPHPTAEQMTQGRALWAQANAGTTVGEHVVMVPQLDGSIKPVTISTTSTKTFSGAPQGTKTPKPAGQQKKDLAAITGKSRAKGAGVVSVGETVGGKRTTAQNKADNDYVEATKLASVADQVAAKPNDAINQKRLAVSLERASAGRFTTQALDYIIKAGWGNTIEQWANNPSTGALPKDVMRQLVDGAHENLNAAKAAREAAFTGSSPTSSGDVSDDDIINALKKK